MKSTTILAFVPLTRVVGWTSFVRTVRTESPIWSRKVAAIYSTTTPTTLSSSSQTDGHDVASSNKLVEQQKVASNDKKDGTGNRFITEVAFLRHQQQVFDELADTFSSGELVTDDLIPTYEEMAQRMLEGTAATTTTTSNDDKDDNGEEEEEEESDTINILDVACGSGVLWPFLAKSANRKLAITGVDLSENMVAAAAVVADNLFEEYLFDRYRHSFAVIESEITEYESETRYDLITVNACFGNFWKPIHVLQHLSNLCTSTIIISHPLGKSFVKQLHDSDPSVVPHLLPGSKSEWEDLLLTVPLELTELHDEDYYLARLRKIRARGLSKIIRLRGTVDTGYGRGGKKLGFPTANLPSRLFQDALEKVATGVYFGFAVVEGLPEEKDHDNNSNNMIFPAVVNVGYSPTFEGQENKEKIVEAHLMVDEELSDFYGNVMRLQLIGYLRPEIKFPSFPDLIAQINADVVDAKTALMKEPYVNFKSDPFLDMTTTSSWTGTAGGNGEASWEFQNIRQAMQDLSS